jgi:hypothetical protein
VGQGIGCGGGVIRLDVAFGQNQLARVQSTDRANRLQKLPVIVRAGWELVKRLLLVADGEVLEPFALQLLLDLPA